MHTTTFPEKVAFFLACWLLLVARCSAQPVETNSLFAVGNSLTFDFQPGLYNETLLQAGLTADVGYHIRTGSTLTDIWNNPTPSARPSGVPFTNPDFGAYQEGLANFNWDAISLQPHPRGGDTQIEDADAILNFISLSQSEGLNQDANYYVYIPWPEVDSWGLWESPSSEPDQPANRSLDYYLQLESRVASQTDASIGLIPIGEVWFDLREDILNGLAPTELTSPSVLYRDALHASGLGRYINSLTVAAVVNGVDIRELPNLDDGGDAQFPTGLSETTIDYIQDSIWTTIEQFSNARGDLDRNGLVTLEDLDIWASQFGPQQSVMADLNNDNRVDEADLSLWHALTSDNTSFANVDFNGDNLIDPDDFVVFANSFGDTSDLDADANGDNVVDAADFVLFRDLFTTPGQIAINLQLADINGDGVANELDLQIVEDELGNELRSFGDINSDGQIDAADYVVFRDRFPGSGPLGVSSPALSASAIPEPTTASLLMVGLLLSWRRRA